MAASYGYFSTKLSAAGSQTFQLRSDGTWSVARSGFTSGVTQRGTPLSGTWTSDASVAYEYTITKASKSMGTASPTTTTTTWTTLSNIALSASTPGGGVPEGDATWTVNIRKKGTTSPVLVINVELDTANGD